MALVGIRGIYALLSDLSGVLLDMRALSLGIACAFLSLPAHADRFKEWDRNKDGKLQRDELPPNERRNFERVDKDRDGVISLAEHKAFLNRRTGSGQGQQEHPDCRTVENLDYTGAGNQRQTLDLFLPREQSDKLRPLLVYIHGGGWRAGSKEGAFRRLQPLLEGSGFAGAAINYRLTDEASWPAQIHDCKAAIRWLRAHARKYGYDPERIAVWGTSAGGHLVSMLGVTGDVPRLDGKLGKHLDQKSSIRCVVNYFGPSNLLTMDDYPSNIKHSAADSPEGKLVGGALLERKKIAMNASPVSHVSSKDVPMLIAHGTKDMLVPYQQSVELSKGLEKHEVDYILLTMKDAGHGFRSKKLIVKVREFLAYQLMGQSGNLASETILPGQ
jgi:acetyl esterase/lipase